MILVDTSVLIDYLKGSTGEKNKLFENILSSGIPFGISAYTYQEILQGARDQSELNKLRDYLSSQTVYFPPKTLASYDKAAFLFYKLRRQGITIRGSIDILIAITAIENDLILLHNDRDFDTIAQNMPDLRILE